MRSMASRWNRPSRPWLILSVSLRQTRMLPERFTAVESAVQTYKGDKAVIVHLNDVFSLPRYLMGMQDLLMAIALEPELVKGFG